MLLSKTILWGLLVGSAVAEVARSSGRVNYRSAQSGDFPPGNEGDVLSEDGMLNFSKFQGRRSAHGLQSRFADPSENVSSQYHLRGDKRPETLGSTFPDMSQQ